MSLIVHHLNNSRSQRVLWLLEELGLPYEIRHYQRDLVTNLAPPELKDVHPLGKSPLLEEDGVVIEESGAIVQHLIDAYGKGRFAPASRDALRHLQWMHWAEGSAMTPILLQLYTARLGEAAAPLLPRISEQLNSHFAYLENELRPSGHFVGDDWTGADVMLSFPSEIAVMQGQGAAYPKLAAFVAAVHARPAWQRAREKGGAYYGF